jgi:hypothetical protein
MTTTLSAAAMADFEAPSAGKLVTSDDDEGDVSTVDLYSRRTSSESEASCELPTADPRAQTGERNPIDERRLNLQIKRTRPALEDVLLSLPHFQEACLGAEEDGSDDEDVVLRIGQLARRLALGHGADECYRVNDQGTKTPARARTLVGSAE